MDKYNEAITNIIHSQEEIVGENIATLVAQKVGELQIDDTGTVRVAGDPKSVLEQLVTQYSQLFGRASIEVCKEALKKVTPAFSAEELPDILK